MPSSLENLIAAARDGSEQALEELLGRYRHFIELLVRSRCKGGGLQARVDSSDIVQETLMRVARHIGDFDGGAEREWEGWLRTIAEREVIRQLRYHLGTAGRDADREQAGPADDSAGAQALANWLEASITSPSLAFVRKERALLLADALARLPEDHREVLVMRHLEERPFPEIAETMDRSAGAVRVLWVRALRRLREAIDMEIELSMTGGQ